MMNKLEVIRTAVASHFAVKEAHDLAVIQVELLGYKGITDDERKALAGYNGYQNTAMSYLHDLLPLLDAAVICGNDVNYSDDILGAAVFVLNNEVHKLLEETT